MNSERQKHWARVYEEKASTSVSWYQAEPEPSLLAIDSFGVRPSSALIDVGGGASSLVDALTRRGWADLTVLDIAPAALEAAKARLGKDASRVQWVVADITTWQPERRYDVWHDRAVFHFLIAVEQRAAYRRALLAGLRAGGLVIMATFAPDGPDKCSGLPVKKYDPASLSGELGECFELLDGWREEHITPGGTRQSFNWCVFRRKG